MRTLTKYMWTLTFFYPKRAGIDVVQTGQKIKEICRAHGLTVKMIQAQLYLGTFQSVYAWFSGKSLPSLDNIYRLSRVLGVPMDHMVVGTGTRHEIGIQPQNLQPGRPGEILSTYYNRWKSMVPYFCQQTHGV